MKTLKQIQEENRKFIITACNPEAKTYEEALEMDQEDLRTTLSDNCEIDDSECFDDLVEVLYKPLTLNRVLLSLLQLRCNLNLYDDDDGITKVFIRIDTPLTYEGGFYWDLTKETLEEQLEETQRAVHKLNNK